MTLAYFDCFAGAAGDMIVGALLDAGCDFAALEAALRKLPVGEVGLSAETAQRGGLAGTKFTVTPSAAQQPHRHLGDILSMIDAAALSDRAAERARATFQRLGEAEAKVHNIAIEKVHFHEVGAIDSIIDIVGACVAMELLGIDEVACSPLRLGSGTVECEHGTLPVPAPATANLLTGVPTLAGDVPGEATTPTAAALLTTLPESFGALPEMNVRAVGYGAGTRETGPTPNLLRVWIGDRAPEGEGDADAVVELSANLDDCTGEVLGATIERLLTAGCLDAWATPAVMKRSRPAWVLSALAHPAEADRAEEILFAETTTFGVRRRRLTRRKLNREWKTVETRYGPIRMKTGLRGGRRVSASPEFADCDGAAKAHGVGIRDVIAAAQSAFARERA